MQPLIRSTKQVAIGPETKELSLTDLWLVIRKRRVLLLCMALGIGALAGAAGLLRGKRYTATGEVQIQPGSGSALKESISAALGAGSSTLDVVLESDIRILESDTLLTAVARKLNLASNPEFMGGGSNAGPSFLIWATGSRPRCTGTSTIRWCGRRAGQSARGTSDGFACSAHADDHDFVLSVLLSFRRR